MVTAVKESKKEQPYFRDMFLYIAEKLPKVLENLKTEQLSEACSSTAHNCHHDDPIGICN